MNKEQIFGILKTHILEIMDELSESDINITDELETLGANSMDRADIIMMTMETLDLDIPRVELLGETHIEEIIDIFLTKLS